MDNEYDFLLVGIVTSENDYRLSWLLNSELGTGLVKTDNLRVYSTRLQSEQEFTHFTYYDEKSLLDYHLIGNKAERGHLLEDMKNVDYVLKISGMVETGYMSQLISRIKKLEGISTAFRISPAEHKNTDKLIF